MNIYKIILIHVIFMATFVGCGSFNDHADDSDETADQSTLEGNENEGDSVEISVDSTDAPGDDAVEALDDKLDIFSGTTLASPNPDSTQSPSSDPLIKDLSIEVSGVSEEAEVLSGEAFSDSISLITADTSVLIKLARHLSEVQNTDGSFDWQYHVDDDLTPDTTGYQNVTGVSILGLFDMLALVDSETWQGALDTTKSYFEGLLDGFLNDPYNTSKNLSCSNWAFLFRYLQATPDATLESTVVNAFDQLLEVRDEVYGDDSQMRVDGLYNRIIEGRAPIPGIIPWDLALCAESVEAMAELDGSFSDDADDAIDMLANYTENTFLPSYDEDTLIQYGDLSISMPLYVIAHSSQSDLRAQLITDLSTRLENLVNVDGYISNGSANDNPYQASAYGLLALKEIESSLALTVQTYLESLVNDDGSVVDPETNVETFEVTGEILRVLAYAASLDCGAITEINSNSVDCRTENFLDWLTVHSLDTYRIIIESDLQDSGKASHFENQLNVSSAFKDYYRGAVSPVVQLVDVNPSNAGWSYVALTEDDVDTLEDYLSEISGKEVDVQLTSVFIDYETQFAGHIITTGSGKTIICTYYDYPEADPDIPIIYTYGVTYDGDGTRTIASCSGGLRDNKAMVGSTSRPISPSNKHIYAHELYHSMGIGHHYESAVSSSQLNKNLGALFLYGTDCIMSDGYVAAGFKYSSTVSDLDSYNRYRMVNMACPICYYLFNPTSSTLSDYVSDYEYEANWLDRYDASLEAMRPQMIIDAIPNQTLVAGETLSITVTVTDGGGNEYYRLYDNDGASGLTLNSSSGQLTWETDSSDVGSYEVTLIVYDGTLAASDVFTITINP